MSYTKQTWANSPSGGTPLDADRLNYIEAGIEAIDLTDGGTLGEAANLVLGTATGTKIGTAVSQKLGFHNVTPVTQRAGADQAAVAATAATSTTPFGYTEAQANAIVTLLNEIRAALVAKGLIKGAA